MSAPSLSAIVLTFDEALHIERCLASLAPVCQRICVVDSYSRDATVSLARALGAEVFEHPFVNQSDQFNWALDHCHLTTEWVLRLDADEYLEPALVAELREQLPLLPADVHGVLMARRYFFMGRWVRHGGLHPLYHLRAWRTGSARIERRWMDEHAVLERGRAVRFAGTFVDDNLRDLAWWSEKHVRYATREAVQVMLERPAVVATEGQRVGGQAGLKRWIKQRLYNKLPLGVGPLLLLGYRLFVRLGLLDGPTGVAFHVLQAFWYRLLVDLRRLELQRALAGLTDDTARVARLEQLTGLPVAAFRTDAPPGE